MTPRTLSIRTGTGERALRLRRYHIVILVQYAITWAAVRSHTVHSLVKSDPTVLLLNGRYLEGAMREQRVTRDEIEAALRDHGSATASNIACVMLETDGSLSVVPSSKQAKETARNLGEAPSTPGGTAERHEIELLPRFKLLIE